MKKLILIISITIPLLTFSQWNGMISNPQYPSGQTNNDLFSKGAVNAGISVVTIGFPSYMIYTNTNQFHNLNNSQQDAAIVGIIGGSLVSGFIFGISKDYVISHKKQIKRKWKILFR